MRLFAQDAAVLLLIEGNGKIVELERAAASRFVAGLKPGTTNLLAFDTENNLIVSHLVKARAGMMTKNCHFLARRVDFLVEAFAMLS